MKTTALHPLLDELIATEDVRNDADIGRALHIPPPKLSRIRHGKFEVTDAMRVAIMRRFKWSLKRIDELAPPAAAEE